MREPHLANAFWAIRDHFAKPDHFAKFEGPFGEVVDRRKYNRHNDLQLQRRPFRQSRGSAPWYLRRMCFASGWARSEVRSQKSEELCTRTCPPEWCHEKLHAKKVARHFGK